MNSRDALYFKQAEHCRRMSDASKIEETKAEWLLLAERWLRMSIRGPETGAAAPVDKLPQQHSSTPS